MFDALIDSLSERSVVIFKEAGAPDWSYLIIVFIVIAASTYLGSYLHYKGKNLATKEDVDKVTHATESIKTEFLKQVENLRYEHGVMNRTFEIFVDNIIDYYSLLYDHYIRCQQAAEYVYHLPMNGPAVPTSELFIKELEEFVHNWNAKLGKVVLLLPDDIIVLHDKIQDLFNKFRDIIMEREKFQQDQLSIGESNYNDFQIDLREVFKKIHASKEEMQSIIRKILRVNRATGVFENHINKKGL
ncbi:MAG: hypothetical protein GWP19_10995 [Planctomycetia bacterium]|nr:hypothetical protein [Planctomycetia bacterium]